MSPRKPVILYGFVAAGSLLAGWKSADLRKASTAQHTDRVVSVAAPEKGPSTQVPLLELSALRKSPVDLAGWFGQIDRMSSADLAKEFERLKSAPGHFGIVAERAIEHLFKTWALIDPEASLDSMTSLTNPIPIRPKADFRILCTGVVEVDDLR